MKERTILQAKHFGQLGRIKAFEEALLKIPGIIESVDFDLDGWFDNIRQVIICPKYNWRADRTQIIRDVINAAKELDLHPSGDAIEDYGEHLYFVFDCGESWPSRFHK